MKRRVRGTKRRAPLIGCMILYASICAFGIIWLGAAVRDLEYEVANLDSLRVELVREKKMAVAERARVYSLDKVEKVALKRLGMTLPERDNVFFITTTPAAAPYKASLK